MFRRILVPLDGSERAEKVIHVAARIARASGGSIVLLRVTTLSTDFAWQFMESPLIVPQALKAERDQIIAYLAHLASSEVLEGIGIATEVASGVPAQTILSVAHSQRADLIVMCSHGYTGFKRWLLGGVAQKVACHSSVPVLVLREGAGIPSNLHPEGTRPVRMLVALDGSSLAEAALAPAATLSIALSAPEPGALHLLRVVPLPKEAHHNGDIKAARTRIITEAQAYLHAVQQRILAGGRTAHLHITSSTVVDPDIAGTLIEHAEIGEAAEADGNRGLPPCDVIAMATHGRGGLEHWAMGSMTERVLGSTRLPLLIIRPQKTESADKEMQKSSEASNNQIKEVELQS